MPSSIESVGSYTVILAETFAAVGLASLVPTALIAAAQATKGALIQAPAERAIPGADAIRDNLKDFAAVAKGLDVLGAMAEGMDDFHVLLPKTAHIESTFEFEGSDKVTENVSGGVAVQVVNVNAGFSMMYESKSTNRITMDIDFQSVNIPL
ncbi:MAG: hypothetical protein JWP27_854 [Flaviaesturariibacter sp.]|nr:hypothetical protein [Flaviaesturariibacter sp.]